MGWIEAAVVLIVFTPTSDGIVVTSSPAKSVSSCYLNIQRFKKMPELQMLRLEFQCARKWGNDVPIKIDFVKERQKKTPMIPMVGAPRLPRT